MVVVIMGAGVVQEGFFEEVIFELSRMSKQRERNSPANGTV